MNSINLVGRLTAEPELRYTPTTNKAGVRVNIAVDRGLSKEDKDAGKKSADFIPLVVWDKKAETLNKYCKKGHRISVNGRLVDGRYEKQDGTTGYTLEVHVDKLELIESKPKDERPEPEYTGYETSVPAEAKEATDGFTDFANEVILTDDDLPF